MANYHELKGTKKRQAWVIGSPIAHSISPLMHRYWLQKHGIFGGYYDPLEVSPSNLESTLHSFWMNEEVVGLNVTIPHKEAVSAFCYALSPRALRTSSVNTLIRRKQGWFGDSSDGWGFVASLKVNGDISSKVFRHIVILGAGGAACSIADALFAEKLVGEKLSIVNRNLSRASVLCDRLRNHWRNAHVVAKEKKDWPTVIKDADILIQTTSMGLVGGPRFDYSLEGLQEGCVVADIVYNPLMTPCISAAMERGHPVVDGLGMLMYQGVVGFRDWFGLEPVVDEGLRSFLKKKIGKK